MAWVFVPLYLVTDRGARHARGRLDTPPSTAWASIVGGNLVGGIRRRTASGCAARSRSPLLAAAVGWRTGAVHTHRRPAGGARADGRRWVACGRPVSFALITAAGLPTDQRRQASALMRAVNNAGTVLGPPIGAGWWRRGASPGSSSATGDGEPADAGRGARCRAAHRPGRGARRRPEKSARRAAPRQALRAAAGERGDRRHVEYHSPTPPCRGSSTSWVRSRGSTARRSRSTAC